MRHLKTYAQLNESSFQYANPLGETRDFNGVKLECYYEVEVTKPDLVEYKIRVRPTKEELARTGIWSESYIKNPSDGFNIFHGVKVFEEESEFEDWGIDSVKELTTEDIQSMFYREMKEKMKKSYTPKDLFDAVDQFDERGDWELMSPQKAKTYGLLTSIGGI